jgi:hypothetical protein
VDEMLFLKMAGDIQAKPDTLARTSIGMTDRHL